MNERPVMPLLFRSLAATPEIERSLQGTTGLTDPGSIPPMRNGVAQTICRAEAMQTPSWPL